MSRRREPKAPSAVEGLVVVSIVCTGRGTHNEVSFGTVSVLPNGRTVERLAESEFFVGIDLEAEQTLKTIPFLCKRCTPARNVPLRRASLDRICVALVAAGETHLDLSALGAIGPISS